jgi:ribonuclease P protein component
VPVWPPAKDVELSIDVVVEDESVSLPDLSASSEILSQWFPPSCRIRTPTEYQRVFSKADFRTSNDAYTLIARRNSVGHLRLGMAVSRKVSKRAVERNRFKREIREFFRTWPARHLLALDLVVIAKPTLLQREPHERRHALSELFTKVMNRFTISPSDPTRRAD